MRLYESGDWGFGIMYGWVGSVFPRSFCIALPNAIFCFCLGTYFADPDESVFPYPWDSMDPSVVDRAENAMKMLALFSTVQFFILAFRSNVAYSRWWEGGTLLQKTRGEWFNSYSSLIAFSAVDPAKAEQVEEFQHLLARLMSLLFCAALQQVSPDHHRAFEVFNTAGIEEEHIEFLQNTPDKVELILQWIQRSTVLNMANGVIPIAPPILSRAFQEISRGIVNLQNARKIADFPFPFPYAQMSITMLVVHWVACPILSSMMLPRMEAALVSFVLVFFLWCINFIALQLEFPFGERDNDLPMLQFQRDWNKSLGTLLHEKAQRPPTFEFKGPFHRRLDLLMSDGSESKRKLNLRECSPGEEEFGDAPRESEIDVSRPVGMAFGLTAPKKGAPRPERKPKVEEQTRETSGNSPASTDAPNSPTTKTGKHAELKPRGAQSEFSGTSTQSTDGPKSNRTTGSTGKPSVTSSRATCSSEGTGSGNLAAQEALLANILAQSTGKPAARHISILAPGEELSPRARAQQSEVMRSSAVTFCPYIEEDDEEGETGEHRPGEATVGSTMSSSASDRILWQRQAVDRARNLKNSPDGNEQAGGATSSGDPARTSASNVGRAARGKDSHVIFDVEVDDSQRAIGRAGVGDSHEPGHDTSI